MSKSKATATNSDNSDNREDGQATVELILMLPVVIMFLLLVIQVGLVVRAQILVADAARNGARAAITTKDTTAPERAAKRTPGLDPAAMEVEVNEQLVTDLIRVEVRYKVKTDVPLIGSLVGDRVVKASTAMAKEISE